METLIIKPEEAVIQESLKHALDYSEYRELLYKLAENGATTGPDQSSSLINYTFLNSKRFRRWEKTFKTNDQVLGQLDRLNLPGMTWLVITESWCGDAAHLIPVMKKLADELDNVDFKVVLRDETPELMDRFLTNGSRSIPKLIAIDERSGQPLFTYGPRPSVANRLVEDYKKEHGVLTKEFKEELQRWYNKDKGQTTFTDLVQLLQAL